MSLNHPKPKQIRLPFTVPKPGLSPAPKRVCGICRKRDSQYTCPKCNVAYCSLDCFRDQVHAQCSEPFYKTTVMESISTDPKAGLEEKRKMMEMLRRFEDAQIEGEGAWGLDDDEEEDALVAALDGVDLDDIDSNKLFHLLPQHHRDAFLAAIRDPDSSEAKELLRSAVDSGEGVVEEGSPSVLPWWEGDTLDSHEDGGSTAGQDDQVRYAVAPTIIDETLVAGVKPPDGTGLKLVYNAVAICLAYIHILLSMRLPCLSPSHLDNQLVANGELKLEFSTLVPFLIDAKSTIRYGSVREAWEAVWEMIGASMSSAPNNDLLIRLLSTTASLVHPSIVSDHPSGLVRVLSDVYPLFAKPKAGGSVPRKLVFYIAAMRQLGRDDRLRVEKEVEKEIAKLREELGSGDESDGPQQDRPALKIVD